MYGFSPCACAQAETAKIPLLRKLPWGIFPGLVLLMAFGAGALSGVPAKQERPALGQPAPELPGELRAHLLTVEGLLVLLAVPSNTMKDARWNAAACETGDLLPRLRELNAHLVVASASAAPDAFASLPPGARVQWVQVEDAATLAQYLPEQEQLPQFYLLDEKRTVRRIQPLDSSLDAAASVLAQWVRGRNVYTANCARCHGNDGRDLDYPFVKPIAGLGKTMSEAELLEASWEAGFVNPASLNEDAKAALGVYLKGL